MSCARARPVRRSFRGALHEKTPTLSRSRTGPGWSRFSRCFRCLCDRGIELGGEVGNTQYDSQSQQTRGELVEIDPAVDKIIARHRLPGARQNHGLLIDSQGRLALVACEGNDKRPVFDLGAQRVTQSFDVGNDPDLLALDSANGRLYVAGEAGVASVFAIEGSHVAKIGEGKVGPNAHVVAIDPVTHRAFFPLKNVDGHPVLRVMAPV